MGRLKSGVIVLSGVALASGCQWDLCEDPPKTEIPNGAAEAPTAVEKYVGTVASSRAFPRGEYVDAERTVDGQSHVGGAGGAEADDDWYGFQVEGTIPSARLEVDTRALRVERGYDTEAGERVTETWAATAVWESDGFLRCPTEDIEHYELTLEEVVGPDGEGPSEEHYRNFRVKLHPLMETVSETTEVVGYTFTATWTALDEDWVQSMNYSEDYRN